MSGPYTAHFIKKIAHTSQLSSFLFSIDDNSFHYRAGQYAEIEAPHAHVDGRGTKRWMSFSSAPSEKYIQILSRLNPKPSSFKRALFSLKPGDEIHIGEPMGDFVAPHNNPQDLFFIAGGIGIAPFRSLAQYFISSGQKNKTTLLYVAPKYEEFLFLDDLSSICTEIHLFSTREKHPKAHGIEQFDTILRDHLMIPDQQSGPTIYIAGPAPFVEEQRAKLLAFDVDPANILSDYFFGYDDKLLSG